MRSKQARWHSGGSSTGCLPERGTRSSNVANVGPDAYRRLVRRSRMSQLPLIQPIPVLTGVKEGLKVRNQGEAYSNNVFYGEAPNGERYVCKGELDFRQLIAEAVGYHVSSLLGVRTPEVAVVVKGPDEWLWLSKYLTPTKHWDALDYAVVENLSDLGAMLALDCALGNYDRRSPNILLWQNDSGEWGLWSIDMEKSWVGTAQDLLVNGAVRQDVPNLRVEFAVTLPIHLLRAPMRSAAQTLVGVSPSTVGALVADACRLFDPASAAALVPALTARLQMASALVETRITQLDWLTNLPGQAK